MFAEVAWPARVLVMMVALGHAPGAVGREGAEDAYQWFSLPIQVTRLPGRAESVPVSCHVDFTELLSRLKVAGAVDERSIRLLRIAGDGKEIEEPVQFSADPQPHVGPRQLLPGTGQQVSYLAEYGASEKPPVKVAGALAWFARAGDDGTERYRLRFGVPRNARFVQVPFPPQNLRAFDDQRRATPIRYFPRMQIRPQWPLDGAVHISDGRELVTSYHIGPLLEGRDVASSAIRRPFFYPVNGPDGIGLTEFGKPHDPTGSHAHHYSLWIAHASVAGHDFWSERGGAIAHDQLELQEDGPVFCRLVQKTRWAVKGVEILRERRCMTVFAESGGGESFRLIDFDLQFSPGGPQPVELGKTSFGFLAVRVAQSMTPFDGGGEIMNARGDRNEQAAHLKRAEWIDQSGPVLAAPDRPKWNGIAIFDHPGNPNYPTAFHCRNDGWAGASFNAEAPHTIASGGTLRLRYRIHLHRGNAGEGQVASRYREYAAQPEVVFGSPNIE